MKALSIQQPWAWLICKGYKDVENRDWQTNMRGRIYIHTGIRDDTNAYSSVMTHEKYGFDRKDVLRDAIFISAECSVLLPKSFNRSDLVFGAIIGEVDIIDCVTESKSPWFVGKYGFVLRNPKLYKAPIPCKGRLGFFEPEITVGGK